MEDEQRPEEVDLGGEPTSGADPLAEVEPESVFDEGAEEALPPGVEQGSLGGENPSEATPEAETPEPDPLAEPTPGEFLEEPDEDDGEDDEPEQELPEPAAPPVPSPSPDDEPPVLPEDEPPPEEPVEVPTPVEETPPKEEPVSEPPSSEADKKKPTAPRRRRRRAAASDAADQRGYKPFQQAVGFNGQELAALAKEGKLWIEHEPIESRSGQAALRTIYRDLSDGQPGEFRIAAVPAKLWKPKKVAGRSLNQMAIEVGD